MKNKKAKTEKVGVIILILILLGAGYYFFIYNKSTDNYTSNCAGVGCPTGYSCIYQPEIMGASLSKGFCAYMGNVTGFCKDVTSSKLNLDEYTSIQKTDINKFCTTFLINLNGKFGG